MWGQGSLVLLSSIYLRQFFKKINEGYSSLILLVVKVCFWLFYGNSDMGQIYQSFHCNAFKLRKSFPMQRSHEMFACIFPVQNFVIFNSLIYVTFIFLWGVRSEAKLVSFYECLISCPRWLILVFSPTDDHLLYHEVAHTLGLFQAGSLPASHKKRTSVEKTLLVD